MSVDFDEKYIRGVNGAKRATEIVRPEAHAAVKELENTDLYDASARGLTDAEVGRLFGDAADS